MADTQKAPVNFSLKQTPEPYTLCLDRPLGAVVTEQGTDVALWAPTAKSVELRLFSHGSAEEQDDQHIDSIAMTRQEDGSWTWHSDANLHGTYYDFLLRMDNNNIQRSADPWARAAGVNGRRSMIVDLSQTNPQGWDEDTRPQTTTQKTMVWEAHVGSFSNDPHSGVPEQLRGKYLAFTLNNTTLDNQDNGFPTCMAYLRELGVTAVQLLPFYDYGSVDESDPDGFNWGYDPVNYNVPEGSYATNPYDGAVRITECKQMIQALHAAGIKVIMDVVYNHMFVKDNWFERTVPGYFIRRLPGGDIANGSGCGNDMFTEHRMFRRFMVESVAYWAREYHVDGFRFDLMGLIDTDTMNDIRAALDVLPGGRDIIMYGEPWRADDTATLEGTLLADKEGLDKLDPRIGHFCDTTRDAIKGHVFEVMNQGFVNGDAAGHKEAVAFAVDAWRTPDTWEGYAGQIIQYVSAHDDYTLWDKLCISMYGEQISDLTALYEVEPSEAQQRVLEANKIAAGLIWTAAGIPFMLAGEEIAKTKYGNHNSFDSGKKVNQMDWTRAQRMQHLTDYYKRLIELRKDMPEWFSLAHEAVQTDGNHLAYRFGNCLALANPDNYEHMVQLGADDEDIMSGSRKLSRREEAPEWTCLLDSTVENQHEISCETSGQGRQGRTFVLPARSFRLWRMD
ncbi:type I pullulanase [Bifidobacterium dolichotidis]|nr:type I pullulanase [Bifidobacterium dolichotidis]